MRNYDCKNFWVCYWIFFKMFLGYDLENKGYLKLIYIDWWNWESFVNMFFGLFILNILLNI